MTSSSSHNLHGNSTLGKPEMDLFASLHTCQYQYDYTLGYVLPQGSLGLNTYNHPSLLQVNHLFCHAALVTVVLFLTEHATGQFRQLDGDS